MLRRFAPVLLTATLLIPGCADPAADKVQVTATAPKPETPAPDSPGSPTAATPSTAPAADPSAAPAPAAGADTLMIGTENSKVEFIGSKVTGSHSGGFKVVSGTANLTPDGTSLAKVTLDIDMESTYTDHDKLTGHLKSPDFFDTAKFPVSKFVSTEIKAGGEKGATHTIVGNLTLHGVTKSISIPATVVVKDGTVTMNSEFALNRRQFDINYPGMQNDLIRDEVVLKFDVKAAKKA